MNFETDMGMLKFASSHIVDLNKSSSLALVTEGEGASRVKGA
jgi:hypothetical protein